MLRLTLNPRQKLPRGWRWGARTPTGVWLVGARGRRLVVTLSGNAYPVDVDDLRRRLWEATKAEEVQVDST